jgi:uncharacterized protein GlcG (DUF336 family)
MGITLEIAEAVIDGALAEGAKSGMKPLTVAVLDAGGYLVALKRQDGSPLLRPDIARAKAWTALALASTSRAFAETAEARPHFVGGLIDVSGGRMVPAAGGVPIRQNGEIVGAVGISGDTPDNDERAALAGVAAAGL